MQNLLTKQIYEILFYLSRKLLCGSKAWLYLLHHHIYNEQLLPKWSILNRVV